MKMRRLLNLFLVCLFVPVAILSCSRGHFKNYYVIHLEPRNFQNVDERVEKSVKVRRFRSSRMLLDDRIIYMKSPVQIGYHHLDLWVMNVDNMIGDMFYNHLSNSGVFANLYNFNSAANTNYNIAGYVGFLGEVTEQGERLARAEITLFVYDSSNKRIWQNRYERLKKVELSNDHEVFMNDLVLTLSSQVTEIFNQAIVDIAAVLK